MTRARTHRHCDPFQTASMYMDALSALNDPAKAMNRADLRAAGLSQSAITRAVRAGTLVRPRKGVYLHHEASDDACIAAHVGGLVGCVSVLANFAVFVLENSAVHVHLPPHATRLRKPKSAVVRHWRPLRRTVDRHALKVKLFDALLQSTICQNPRAAIATLDSALHLGLIDESDLDEIFEHVPARRRALRPLVDGRAESGSETLVRLMLRSLGLAFEPQVDIEDVGRVDFLVEGWLIIECDSRAFHEGWEAQARDRARDLAAATRGYATLRPVAADIFAQPDMIAAAIRGITEARRAG